MDVRVEFHFDFGSPNAYLAHLVIPAIEKRCGVRFGYVPVLLGGVFKATGNVSPAVALRGIKNKGEFAPKGIHVVHIVIDGAADAPDTLGTTLGPEKFEKLREARGKEHDGLVLPAQIAETYVHLAKQHRSTWTHELDLRAFLDRPWWNH